MHLQNHFLCKTTMRAVSTKRALSRLSSLVCLYVYVIFRRVRKIAKKTIINSVMYVCPSACLSLCLSVRPSVHMEQLGCHWTDFY